MTAPPKALRRFLPLLAAGCILLGCGSSEEARVVVKVGPDAAHRLQEALITSEPGTTILLEEGRYECRLPLSCSVPGITLRGEGMQRTILSFAGQKQGGEGLLVTAGPFTIEDLAIEDTAGDGLKVTEANGVTIRRTRVEWTAGPRTENGGYGIYPIKCTNVLVEECIAVGASDSGVYVGQCEDIVVRNNEVWNNVLGIEIENSRRADVYSNNVHHNSAGLFVFDLPSVPKRNGGHVRVFNNLCHENNLENFAPAGNVAAIAPSGTGVLVMANDSVEIFGNKIHDHGTVNLTICSYRMATLATEASAQENWAEEFEPDPESIYVHDNEFANAGSNPRGSLGLQLEELLGRPLPDIVLDGFQDPRKLQGGELPPELGIWFEGNGEVRFANLHLGGGGPPTRDITPHTGSLPRLSPVELSGGGW